MKRNKKFNLLANNIMTFLLGVLTGIVLTLLFIFIFNIFSPYTNTINKSKQHNKNNELNKNITPDLKLKNKTLKSHESNTYEFYNLLPKMQSPTKEKELKVPVVSNTAEQSNKNNKINKYYYYIQIRIFNKIAEADELKAKLTLQGYETIIEAQPTKLGDRYKLLIGPYSSKSIATVNKTELEHAGFKNIFIRTNKS